jgi:uncharacterized protein (DUF58 family)
MSALSAEQPTASRFDRVPLPTVRMVRLFALASLVALLGAAWSPLLVLALACDALIALAFVVDAFRSRKTTLLGGRELPLLLHAFVPNRVEVWLENPGEQAVSGEWLDALPAALRSSGARGRFDLKPRERLHTGYSLEPSRGLHAFGGLHLRLEGPWSLAARQMRLDASAVVRCYPDLSEPGDALLQAKPHPEPGLARLRKLGEGREFDALRPYQSGDDPRGIDWKASARRGELVSREYVPERNQTVMMMLDCGRHMVGREGERSRLDVALEASLRLARTSLERGDAVGMLAFGSQVRAFVAPAKGRAHLRQLLEASYTLSPELEESDYGAAFDLLGRQLPRRALVCTFTDLVDEDASRVLLARMARLRPKHLAMVVALLDRELSTLVRMPPHDLDAAYRRAAATRLLREREASLSRLRALGANVVSARSEALSAEAINAYLRIKERGLL